MTPVLRGTVILSKFCPTRCPFPPEKVDPCLWCQINTCRLVHDIVLQVYHMYISTANCPIRELDLYYVTSQIPHSANTT